MPPIYVINLARRPDRLARMSDRLAAAGLEFERIEAIDGRSADPAWLAAQFVSPGLLGPLSTAEQACALSHFKAYQHFLTSPAAASASHAVILEDDVCLSQDAGRLLASLDWLPPSARLLKIERALPRALVGRPTQIAQTSGSAIARLHSHHTGAAGYVISREAATTLAEMHPKPALMIDFLLFHPVHSQLFAWLRPLQLTPALVEQMGPFGADSDIEASRRQLARHAGLQLAPKLRREVQRLANQVRRIAPLPLGGARWKQIGLSPARNPPNAGASAALAAGSEPAGVYDIGVASYKGPLVAAAASKSDAPELADVQPPPDAEVSLAVIVLNFKRPQNIASIVGGAREALPNAPIFVLDQGERGDLRKRRDIPWSEIWLQRAASNRGAGARIALAAQLPFDFYIAIDDDVFLTPGQIRALAERVLAEPDRAHGIGGERLEAEQGVVAFRASISRVNAPLSNLNEVYAFSRRQAVAAIDLASRVGVASWRDVRIGDDLLLSCASSKPPLCHDLGMVEHCPTSDAPAIAVWRRAGFRERRAEIARRLLEAQAITVFARQGAGGERL